MSRSSKGVKRDQAPCLGTMNSLPFDWAAYLADESRDPEAGSVR